MPAPTTKPETAKHTPGKHTVRPVDMGPLGKAFEVVDPSGKVVMTCGGGISVASARNRAKAAAAEFDDAAIAKAEGKANGGGK